MLCWSFTYILQQNVLNSYSKTEQKSFTCVANEREKFAKIKMGFMFLNILQLASMIVNRI